LKGILAALLRVYRSIACALMRVHRIVDWTLMRVYGAELRDVAD
jgi:hypothetical protein